MSTTQSPQDEIAAMQATLARHDEDLERIKQQMLESEESTAPPRRALLENIVAELTATRDNIAQELRAVHERLDVHSSNHGIENWHLVGFLAHTERLDAQAAAQANNDLEVASITRNGRLMRYLRIARTDTIVRENWAPCHT